MIADYDKAIQLKPDYLEAYSDRSALRGSIGQLELAIADANEAIRLAPDLAEPYLNRGLAYRLNTESRFGNIRF